jgi:hypothetical protein
MMVVDVLPAMLPLLVGLPLDVSYLKQLILEQTSGDILQGSWQLLDLQLPPQALLQHVNFLAACGWHTILVSHAAVQQQIVTCCY